jgi:hypothetical protein
MHANNLVRHPVRLERQQLVAGSRALLAREVVIYGSDEDRISAIDEGEAEGGAALASQRYGRHDHK